MKKKRFFICSVCLICLLTMSAFAAAPEILAQPQNVYLPDSQEFPVSVSFSVLASGDDLTYQWQSSRNNGETWIDLPSSSNSTAVSPTFTSNMSADQIDYGRVYRCVITGSDGTATTNIVSVSVGAFTIGSLGQFLGYITETGYSIFEWVGQACTKIVSEPLLLFTVGFLALGGAIGIVSRLLSRS